MWTDEQRRFRPITETNNIRFNPVLIKLFPEAHSVTSLNEHNVTLVRTEKLLFRFPKSASRTIPAPNCKY